MITLKTSIFRPAQKQEPCTKNGLHTKKPSQFISPHKTKLISTRTPKSSRFRSPLLKEVNFVCPRHENDVNFDPDSKPSHFRLPHKTKSIIIPTMKSSQLRSSTLKSRQFRPPTRQPSQLRRQH